MIELSVIVANYNSASYLIECLRSLYGQTTAISFEVVVVDNASSDGSRERILEIFPRIKWIQLDYNAGFARANNEGIRQSEGNIILLMNPDTLVEGHAVENCYQQFIGDRFVACGVQLLNADRSPQISGNYFVTGGLNFLLPLPVIGRVVKWLGNLFRVSKPHVPEASQTVEVDWINGAFLMVKRPAMEAAGLLDEDFFLYYEEAEWCSRLKKQGPLCIYGRYHVLHYQGETANAAFRSEGKGYYNLFDRKGLQLMVSGMLRIRKQFGVGWFLFYYLAYTCELPFFWLGRSVQWLFRLKTNGPAFSPCRGYARNLAGLWTYFLPLLLNRHRLYKVL